MEPWQVSFIQKNKFNLLQNTICNSLLRAILQERGVLGENDISHLDAVQSLKGKHAESELLYNLLLTRKGAFNALVDACDRTKQTGALHILQQAYISNSTTWDELSIELKNELSNKLVNYQGNKVKLSECCNHLHHLITGEFLEQLEKGSTPTLVNNQVPDEVEYYIQRTLRSRSKLKSSVFQQHCDDIFVVDGLEKYQLTSLVLGEQTDISGNQINSLTVRYILLEYQGDFERICKLTSFPVHFIRHKDNVYEWVQSSGSVKNLQKNVDDDQDSFLEGEFAARGNRVNVIPDSPGMGKTLLLANVAHQINQEKPNTLIRFIVMKDIVQALSKKEINLELIVSLIAEKSSEFECGRKIVEHILTSEPCILMFDGFDEVMFNQIDIAKQILKTVVTLKSAQIFVTTRPHMREELENTLHVLGYTINPFTESDQVDFLLKFWKMEGAKENETLKQFATSCVSIINSNMTDFERDIAGIPLQCRLLAESYTEQAVRCSEIGFQTTTSQSIGQINSIFEMYERHIKRRLDNWKINAEAIKKIHMFYALELLFPENAHQFHELKTAPVSVIELCALGFFEVGDSEVIRFVHRTFAEFFVAWFAVETKMSEKILSFFLNELLTTKQRAEFLITPFGKRSIGTSFTFNYPVIAYFMNGFRKMYSKNDGNQEKSQLVSMLMDSVYYKQVSRIFLASAVSDYQFVPQQVSLYFRPLQINEKVDSDIFELLLISSKYSSVALMKTFCSQRDLANFQSQSKIFSFELTPLHVALQRGHYHLVEFLLKKYEPKLNNLCFLIHFCVFESIQENKEIIDDKVQIIKLLTRKSSIWLNEKLSDGTVPLLQKDVNCELIRCLIECGADINVLDKNGNSILHKITENPVTPEFYHWLVVSLSERKFKHFNFHNHSAKNSPLHCAVGNVEMLAETLKCFQSNCADFNAEDFMGSSPLFHAIFSGRSVSLIGALIELGADWKKRNRAKQTLIHICAAIGHYRAMTYFLETLKMNVNVKDISKSTPLHFAVMERSKEHELVQQLLITCGADVNADKWHRGHENLNMINRLRKVVQSKYFTGCSDDTPFMEALRDGEGLTLRTIQMMKKHGLPIKANQASKALKYLFSNRNIRSWEIDEEFVRVVEFLISKGGMIQDIPVTRGSADEKYTTIWKSVGVQKNMRAVIQATDLNCLWPHLETSGLLTKAKLHDVQNYSMDSFNKCERFYELVQSKKASFERVCILLIASKQMSPFTLLRQSLYSALPSDHCMFVTPPNFISQFLHSHYNSSLNTMALVTVNSSLTIMRIRDTISNSVDVIQEADISCYLQKTELDDWIVVEVRVLTAELISRLELGRTVQRKIIFVCGAISEDVENCHVVNDFFLTWDDISTKYFTTTARVSVLDNSRTPIFKIFESPMISHKLSQPDWIGQTFPHAEYSVLRCKIGHINMEFQSKSYLCHTIFHYVLPDKLVFMGISIEKLKGFARFGHKIGFFGEYDTDNLDFLVIEKHHQFDEICRQTSQKVHLVEFEDDKGFFKLVTSWGGKQNIQWFLKQKLCEGFPHCDCVPSNEDLVVNLLIKSNDYFVTHRSECLLPMNELTTKALEITKLGDSEKLFCMKALLQRMCGEHKIRQTDFIDQSHGEQIVQLVTQHLSTLLVENELYHVALNTLFPNLAKQTNPISGLGKYQQLGMLKQIDNNRLVFVHQPLAWYFIARLLMGLTETTELEEVSGALRNEVLQNCFEYHDVQVKSRFPNISSPVCVNSPKHKLRSYKFIYNICFRFIEVLLNTNSDKKDVSFSNFIRSIISNTPKGFKWIHACVNTNLFHFLQLILSFQINTLSSALKSAELVVLAVNCADVPILSLVAEQFEKKSKGKLTGIKIYLEKEEVSMVSLATTRGKYCLLEYLLNEQGFRHQLQKHDKLEEVLNYCLRDTANISRCEVNERKRMVDLLSNSCQFGVLQSDAMTFKQIGLYSKNIHVGLIVYLVSLGVNIHTADDNKNNILHVCPEYLTPQEYHQVISVIHARGSTSIAQLFKEFNFSGKTAFHVVVEHLELLDETVDLFSEAGVDFNVLTEDGDSVFVHATKQRRSARFLDALYRSGADIQAEDEDGQPASVYCEHNLTALRYLSSRGVAV